MRGGQPKISSHLDEGLISKRLINLDRRKRGAELEEALKPLMGVVSWRMVAGKSPNNLKSLVNTDFKYTARLL